MRAIFSRDMVGPVRLTPVARVPKWGAEAALATARTHVIGHAPRTDHRKRGGFACLRSAGVPAQEGAGGQVQVLVRDNNVDQALKALKKKMQREGIFREMKLRRHYEKPSERRAREAAEAVRRARKLERKRLEREGF